jgi:hypothetical protein
MVDDQVVKVGDTVCFKCDIEQCGTISAITRKSGRVMLTLTSKYGFEGGYIGGQEVTEEEASCCWVM